MIAADTLHLDRDGLRLEAARYGAPEAPLVMLVHGFPDTPHSWEGVVPGLVEAGYQVLTPWLRGYTHGSARRDARYDLIDCARDLAAWAQAVPAPAVHLVGHDWGAILSMIVTADQPALWRTLSLLAIPPAPSEAGQIGRLLPRMPRQLRLSAYILYLQSPRAAHDLAHGNAAYAEALWRRWSPGWAFDERQFAPVRTALSDPDIAWASTRYYRSLVAWNRPATREALRLAFQPRRHPTLALAGEKDGCMHAGLHHRLTDGAPGVQQARLLPDCGHFLQAECPQAVTEALLQHLRAY